jgi:hypothetical protein
MPEAFFFASKNGIPIGTYDTFEEAMAAQWEGSAKATGAPDALTTWHQNARHLAIYVNAASGIKNQGILRARLWANSRCAVTTPASGQRASCRTSSAWRPINVDGSWAALISLWNRSNALISADVPRCILDNSPRVARLFPDYKAVEKEYYQRTGIFPIMHTVVMRKDHALEHPGLVKNLYRGFCAAKDVAMDHYKKGLVFNTSRIWSPDSVSSSKRIVVWWEKTGAIRHQGQSQNAGHLPASGPDLYIYSGGGSGHAELPFWGLFAANLWAQAFL